MSTSVMQSQPISTPICERHGVKCELVDGFIPFHFCPMCATENEANQRIEEERKRQELLANGIPLHYRLARLDYISADDFRFKTKDESGNDAYVTGAHSRLIEWVNNPKGILYVYGDCGVGKTYLACAVKRRFNEENLNSKIIFANEMFLELRGTFGLKSKRQERDVIGHYIPENQSSIVIIDDLGTQKSSEYVSEAWTAIIDRLYRFDIPTMVTTNYSPGELLETLGDRISSRLASGITMRLVGRDRRIREHWACK